MDYAQTSFTVGDKAKVRGTNIYRKGDLVKVQDEDRGHRQSFKIAGDTKIVRNKAKVEGWGTGYV